MRFLRHLFQNNSAWAAEITRRDPDFFNALSSQQAPAHLWIGCSDSRVPANEIVGLLPGEMFVHRNVANLVIHTDFNCLSVIEFAVSVLQVKHIIVCGHYNCGGVHAALHDRKLGLIDNWLRHLRDIQQRHRAELDAIPDEGARVDRLCELNVAEQVVNVCQTTMVQEAWEQGSGLVVHGWIYSLKDGLHRDLNVSAANASQAQALTQRTS